MEFEENVFEKLSKDVKNASETLTDKQARFLVDTYYLMQKGRIRCSNQIRAMEKPIKDWQKEYDREAKRVYAGKGGTEVDLDAIMEQRPVEEPHETIDHFAKNYMTLENNIKSCLQKYAESKPIGRWMMSIIGIGPVIAAGLIANIDITRVQTAGQIQAFGGLDPHQVWKKGEKRPWNASLKTLYWKIGQSFIKTSGNPKDIYGHVYLKRKEYENKKNENLEYKDQAEIILRTKNFTSKPAAQEMKKIYESGKLPPSHIASRCARYATKLFLSHLFTVWYEMEHGEPAPKPYPIGILNHAHEIPVPNWEGGEIRISA